MTVAEATAVDLRSYATLPVHTLVRVKSLNGRTYIGNVVDVPARPGWLVVRFCDTRGWFWHERAFPMVLLERLDYTDVERH